MGILSRPPRPANHRRTRRVDTIADLLLVGWESIRDPQGAPEARAVPHGIAGFPPLEGSNVAPNRNLAQEPGPEGSRRPPPLARDEDADRRPPRGLARLDLQRGPYSAGARRARELPPSARRPALSRGDPDRRR